MTEAILAGGPLHGRRLDVRDGAKGYETYIVEQPLPASAPPRPPWWQPLRRRHRKRAAIAAIPRPLGELARCAYRRDGQLSDGTPVYWHREGLSIRPPGEGKLHPFLVDALYAVPARDRMHARWVMDLEWWKKARREACEYNPKLDRDESKWIPSVRDELLGKPVRVTEDGGVPHLEICRDR